MKKLILPAFCLSLAFTSLTVKAENTSSTVISVVTDNDDRKAIKSEELPAGVTKTLAGDAYKGWTVKEAVMVSSKPATADAKAPEAYYEVTLTNEKETKMVKFHQDGSLLN